MRLAFTEQKTHGERILDGGPAHEPVPTPQEPPARVAADLLNSAVRRGRARAEALEGRLEALLVPILDGAADEAARRFHQLAPVALTAAAEGVTPTMTMICVKPRPEEAQAVADPDGNPPEYLHVTLAFLSDLEGSLQPLAQALTPVAGSHAPLAGAVGGYGQFTTEDGAGIGILLPDVPGLVELRVAVTEALHHASVAYGRDHGFLPHLTVDNDPEAGELELMMPVIHRAPLHFDEILIVRGDDEVLALPLTGQPPLTAAAGDVVSRIRQVAEEHAPEGGSGDTWWNADERAVYWVDADWTTNEEHDAARAAFLALEGVDSIEGEAESAGPCRLNDDNDYEVLPGWEQVWPESSLSAAGWTPPAPGELVDVPALAKRLRTKTDPVRLAVAEAMVGTTLDGVGLAFDVDNPFVRRLLEQSGSHITHIAETTRLNAQRAVIAAYDQGLSVPDTATLIRAGMREANGARARMIARTELAGAVNGGSLAAAQTVSANGLGDYLKRWLTAPGAAYPRHEEYEELDGQTVPLDAYFTVGDSQLQFPGDPDGDPGETVNCRCAVEYVEQGEEG